MNKTLSYVEWAETRLQPATKFEFTVPEICAALDISDKTVAAAIERGEFHPYARNKSAANAQCKRYAVQRHAIIAWVRRNQA